MRFSKKVKLKDGHANDEAEKEGSVDGSAAGDIPGIPAIPGIPGISEAVVIKDLNSHSRNKMFWSLSTVAVLKKDVAT